MSYFPSKSVTKWVDEIVGIIGCGPGDVKSHRLSKKLSPEKQYEIRKINSDYLGVITLGPTERDRAEATRRNLLDGYVGPGLV